MGTIFRKAYELTISLEEYTRFYTRKWMCYSYQKTHWLEFPVLVLIILDMLICLYMALYLQSTTAYVLANVLFHILSIPMILTLLLFKLDNYNVTFPRFTCEIYGLCFGLNNLFLIPLFIIKTLLIYFNYENISEITTFMNPVIFHIIWIIITLPLFLRCGTLCIALYWIVFPIIVTLICFTFPGYISDRRMFSHYYITNEDLTQMFKLLDGCGKEYEEIDKYNFSSFRKDHEITEKNALLMDDCTICSNLLDVERMNIIKLDCKHSFHSLCLEQWLSSEEWLNRGDRSCPICKKTIYYQNTKYKPPKLRIQLETKSWITRFHYYPIIFSIKLFKFGSLHANSSLYPHKKLLLWIYIITNLIGCACLPIVSGLTENRFICVLSNSLILAILFQTLMQYSALIALRNYRSSREVKFADSWKDSNLAKPYIIELMSNAILFQVLFIVIFGIIGLCLYYIILDIDQFSMVDYIFLGVIACKAFLDNLCQLAVLHILCLIVNVIYDLLIVFPVTLVYVAIKRKGISEIWLRI